MKFIVDIWLDGYDTEEEMKEGCRELIEYAFSFTGCDVKVEEYYEEDNDLLYDTQKVRF